MKTKKKYYYIVIDEQGNVIDKFRLACGAYKKYYYQLKNRRVTFKKEGKKDGDEQQI